MILLKDATLVESVSQCVAVQCDVTHLIIMPTVNTLRMIAAETVEMPVTSSLLKTTLTWTIYFYQHVQPFTFEISGGSTNKVKKGIKTKSTSFKCR